MPVDQVATNFWATVLATPVQWQAHVRGLAEAAERRRSTADYDTGSILFEEALALLALAEFLVARVILEVGTFIGTSTTALASARSVEALYTCDASNDCLPATGVIHTYPKQISTHMLRDLRDRGVKSDLCFFDGALNPEDAILLRDVTTPETVYAFHDYNYGPKIRQKPDRSTYLETMPRKGIGNVALLKPWLSHHALIEPLDGTTLALLIPESRR